MPELDRSLAESKNALYGFLNHHFHRLLQLRHIFLISLDNFVQFKAVSELLPFSEELSFRHTKAHYLSQFSVLRLPFF